VLPVLEKGQQIFSDVLAFLNGHASQAPMTLQSQLTARGTGVGVWEVALNADDRLVITNDTESFSVLGGGVFGFETGQNATLDGGAWKIIAASEWDRGVVESSFVKIDCASGIFEFPDSSMEYRAQSVPTVLEEVGTSPGALESWNNDAIDSISRRVRWGLTGQGHVYWSVDSAVGGTAITWESESFMRRLGFSGEELLSPGSLIRQEADNPCPGVIIPQRPPLSLTRGWEHIGEQLQLADGSYATAQVGTFYRSELEIYLSGPVGNASREDIHWQRQMIPYLYPGAPVTLYQDWGETRLRGWLAEGDAYSSLVTVQMEGEYGKLVGSVSPSGRRADEINWKNSFRMQTLVSLRIEAIQ